MKKIVSIMLVALLATSALFAGMSFSGNFKAAYDFNFGDEIKITPWKTGEAKLAIKATDDNKIWTVTYKGDGNDGKAGFDSDNHWNANASINIANLVKAMGGDMGDFGMTFSAGNNSSMNGLSAYNDVTSNGYKNLKNNGKNSVQLAMNYGSLVKFNIAGDPTDAGRSLIVSALTSPVDGVSISAAYGYKVASKYGDGTSIAFPSDNAVNVAVDVNVAKLAGLDFKLGVSAYDTIGFGDKMVNTLAANAYTTIDMAAAYVEFTMDSANDSNVYGLKAGVGLDNLVENFDLGITFSSKDITKVADNFVVGAEADYALAGTSVALNLKAEYDRAKENFLVRPKMIITF